uniref:Reverse transcriptase domain-containing protein n=1 Tax=Tanacetum cinerariifolium TaxID=118510 RepID=A0A6L2J7G8_TANCI|nr:hypothetical protein [Tanacetum cinerariifolium]
MKTSIQASMSNQTNELKHTMASFFQMNTAFTSGLGPRPSNTIANSNGELKAITTRRGLVLDGPSVPMPPPFINPEEDERVEETLTDPKLDEYTIKVPPSLFQKVKPPSQRNYVVHQRDPQYLLNHDPTMEMDIILKDSVDEYNLADPNDNLFDTILEMFTDEHTLDYSSPLLYDDFDDDLVELESNNDDAYNDLFDSKEDKINESKILIDELDPSRSSDFLPSPECDSVLYKDFPEVDALPSTNNEDKVFNLGILIHENLSEVIIHVTPDKNVKKISISNASLILEDFNPPLYELPFPK